MRASLARVDWLNLSFVADANERGSKGFEAGPGFRFTLPIFNQNQGAIARADAEVERADRRGGRLTDRVDPRRARGRTLRYRQARDDLAAWRTRRPAGAGARRYGLARAGVRAGQTPQVQVLDTNRQLLDARGREAQAAADARRAWAELERSVGRRLDDVVGDRCQRPTRAGRPSAARPPAGDPPHPPGDRR